MPINPKQKKSDQLGMDAGTAAHKLRKLILFSLIQETTKDICFRCKCKIESVDELSIEHKIPWLDSTKPRELFFDLTNIAFSHLKCNIKCGCKPYQKYFNEEDRIVGYRKTDTEYHRKTYSPESVGKSDIKGQDGVKN